MSDSKYGRLFTEEDVRHLISATMGIIGLASIEKKSPPSTSKEMLERALAATEPEHLQFPPDEPLFLIRGKDLAATGTIWGYCSEAERVGASPEFITAAMRASNNIGDWQRENRNLLKIPD